MEHFLHHGASIQFGQWEPYTRVLVSDDTKYVATIVDSYLKERILRYETDNGPRSVGVPEDSVLVLL